MKPFYTWVNKHFFMLNTLTGVIGLAVLVRVGFLACLSSTEWANWVQAVGSIVAIAVAFTVGARQGKDAIAAISFDHRYEANRRYAAYSVIAEAARKHSAICLAIFTPHGFHFMNVDVADVVKSGESVSSALQAIPIHEVGTYEAVDALLALKTNVDYLGSAIGRAVTHLRSFGASPPHFVTYDCAVIRLNADLIQARSAEFIVAMGQEVRP
jgi:hypothetical protein